MYGGGYGGYGGGLNRSGWAQKSAAATRREESAKKILTTKITELARGPNTGDGGVKCEGLIPPGTHLTGPCWKTFKAFAANQGCNAKRRVATPAEKRAAKETRQSKCYWIDVIIPAATITRERSKLGIAAPPPTAPGAPPAGIASPAPPASASAASAACTTVKRKRESSSSFSSSSGAPAAAADAAAARKKKKLKKGQYEVVVKAAKRHTLGLTVDDVATAKHSSKLILTDIAGDSLAKKRCAALRVNDAILEINGVDVRHVSYQYARDLLVSAARPISIVFQSSK